MAAWLPPRRDVISFIGVFALLGAVYLLPPDTALRNVRAAGTLRVCMPPSYPPLVTGDPAAPGIDVELLQAIARDIAVRLVIVTKPEMATDFNPRAWRLTRSQCEVLAGGVVNSETTRSFLDTTSAHATTGWAWIAPHSGAEPQGGRVGVLVAASGLDRISLATYLRAARAQVFVTLDAAELVQGLKDGRFDVGITEGLLASELAMPRGWTVGCLPAKLGRYSVVFGLWKGDLTLKRVITSAMGRIERGGEMSRIVARYLPGGSLDRNEPGNGRLDRNE
jgi:polar amino acid transport system substrate-binding protein/cystine transport system substrate-binding protein/membrane-bound lytic murein transglycosylase F